MVPPNLAASTPPRLSRRFTAQGGLVECVDDRHGRRPPSPSQCCRPSQLRRPTTHRCEPAPPPSGRSAGHGAAPGPEGRLVATRAGGAGSIGSISGRGKRTATPMSARRAAESDRVDDALDRSPSATQSSTPPTRRRRRRQPCVPGDAPALPTRVHPFWGRPPSACSAPRHRPQNTGTGRPRAPTPGTGVAPTSSQWGRPWRLCRPTTHRCEPAPPPPGRGAGHESAPAPEGRHGAARAGGAGSVGSISGRGKRTATPMSALRAAKSDRVDDALDRPPSTTQSSTPRTRRRRRRQPCCPGAVPRC